VLMLARRCHKEVGEGWCCLRETRSVKIFKKGGGDLPTLKPAARAAVTRRGVGIGIWNLQTEAMRIKKKRSELTLSPKTKE